MSIRKNPYWYRVLEHYRTHNYVSNGLTIPFLIGCQPKIYPIEAMDDIEEFLCELFLADHKSTLMTCPNLGHTVIGVMDSETEKIADEHYRKFGSLYITDDSFEQAVTFDDVIAQCESRYTSIINNNLYSFDSGVWSPFSSMDIARFDEVSQPALTEYLNEREKKEPQLDDIIIRAKAGELNHIVPLWHLNVNRFKFSDQPHNLPAKLRIKGLEIIPSVDIQSLLDNMFPEHAEVFQKRLLINEHLDPTYTARVIHHWMEGRELIPPTITFEQRQEGRNLFPADGKHRLNAASSLNAVKIPILVLKEQKPRVLQLLDHSG